MRNYEIDTIKVDELCLSITNYGDLYRGKTSFYLDNLKAKAAKGLYEADKAIKGYDTIVKAGIQMYLKDFGTSGETVTSFTNPAERLEIAKYLESYYKENVFEDIEELEL